MNNRRARLMTTVVGMASYFLAGFALNSSATAQSMNIDFDNVPPGAGAGLPSGSYGAAAGQPGIWNGIGSMSANVPSAALKDLAGNITAATLTSLTANPIFSGTGNGTPLGDDLLLLGDILDLGAAGNNDTFTFNGLANGTYNVYVYAMAPDSAAFRTNVNINASAASGTPGVQVVGGTYTGVFALGITHAFFQNISVTNGQMVINTNCPTGGGFASLAGIQLGVIPTPAGAAVMMIAGLFGTSRRRRT